MKLEYNSDLPIGPRAKLEKDYGTWSILAPNKYINYCFEIALIGKENFLVELKGENDQIKRFDTEEEALTYIESYIP